VKIKVLGAAAGGGSPQWNCRCPNCISLRNGAPGIEPRTQSSVAVSSDGDDWYLLNVSPDIRQQIQDCSELTPPGNEPRGTGIAGCVLTDAEIDHTTGLLLLRENANFRIYSTPLVRRWLNDYFPIEPIVSAFVSREWEELSLGEPTVLVSGKGKVSTLRVEAFDLDTHPPLFAKAHTGSAEGSVVGLIVEDMATGGKMVYAPGVEAITPALRQAVEGTQLFFMDGTLWSNEEMITLGLSQRTGLDMGHIAVSGNDGSLQWLAGLDVPERIYLHINNTNPILDTRSDEFHAVRETGVRVATDGDAFDI
jgi:pyrroloquinoline quinone biosynthesis protein B